MKFSAKKFNINLKLSAFIFSIVCFTTATTFAQNINDDLKPKQPAAKIKSKPKTKVKTETKAPVKTIKKTSSRSVTKSKVARTVSVQKAQTNNFAGNEMPDQIINRYMNFQQSSGVTERDWKSVIAQTEKTLQSNPNHSVAKVQSLIARGQIALMQNNFVEALNQFKSASRIMPTSSLPYYCIGKTYLANGQAEAAERSFKSAVDQNDKFALAYKGLGDAFTAQGDNKTAMKYFKKSTEISVRNGNMAP